MPAPAQILAIVVCLASSSIELFTTVDMCSAMKMCGHSRLQVCTVCTVCRCVQACVCVVVGVRDCE